MRASSLLLISLTFLNVSVASGPWLPERLLGHGALRWEFPPPFLFEHEMVDLAREFPAEFRAIPALNGDHALQTYECDLADIKAAAAVGAITPEVAQFALTDAAFVRGIVQTPLQSPLQDIWRTDEFSLYHQGSFHFHNQNPVEAKRAWESLLALPEGQRKWRSTWAHYMLGKLLLEAPAEESPEQAAVRLKLAVRSFQNVRSIAKAGFVDSLGLAASGYGWEAYALLELDSPEEAAKLFLTHIQSGDQLAANSLNGLGTWDKPLLRRIAIRTLISRGNTKEYGPSALTEEAVAEIAKLKSQPDTRLPDAERIAWLAYETGNYSQAESLLAVADPALPASLWLKSRLQARAGDLAGASKTIAKALPLIRPLSRMTPASRGIEGFMPFHAAACGEAAMQAIACGKFPDALHYFLVGNHWQDAAFAAERLLTLAELKKAVDTAKLARASGLEHLVLDDVVPYNATEPTQEQLRWLFARRCVREGKPELAKAYFPEKMQESLAAYREGLAKGADKKLSADQRAQGLWAAAQVAREDGMELMGTEVEPDNFFTEGAYEAENVLRQRLTGTYDLWEQNADGSQKTGQVKLTATKAEIARLKQHVVTPEARFHYRVTAANLAKKAASLLPNTSEEAANMVHTAATWLWHQERFPAETKAMIHHLVTNYGSTKIAKACRGSSTP